MLTGAELAAAQADYAATFLTDTAQILRQAKTQDAVAGTVIAYNPVYAPAGTPAVRLRERRMPDAQVIGEEETTVLHFNAEVPVGTVVLPPDRMIIPSVGGETYEVLDTDVGKSESLVLTVYLKRVE